MRVKLGVVGCGNISEIYLQNLCSFGDVEVVAISDMDLERARARAQQFGIPRALTVEALLEEPDIEAVLNLTIPKAHFEVAMAALEAGKSVYNEKPLAVELEEARKILELAGEKALRVGCAPETLSWCSPANVPSIDRHRSDRNSCGCHGLHDFSRTRRLAS